MLFKLEKMIAERRLQNYMVAVLNSVEYNQEEKLALILDYIDYITQNELDFID